MVNFVDNYRIMKIGFDGKRAVSNMTGLGNYSRLVIESLSSEYPDDELVVYTPRLTHNKRLEKIVSSSNVSFRTPAKGEARLGNSLWRIHGITQSLRNDRIELYHGLSNELPLNIAKCGIPTVVTMHDVIYRRLPYCYKAIDRYLYNWKYGESCRNATKIVAVSERTKLDVMEYYGIPEERIEVIYQGCDDIFRKQWGPTEISSLRHKYRLPGRYIVQVGTIERRKNAELGIRALAALPADTHLVLVGRPTSYYDKIMKEAIRLGTRNRIIHLQDVPFAELPGIYQGAAAAIYPSRYEGFGIPVLEALASRIPCVAATGSCLEEAGGDAAVYISPDDAAALAEALRAIISGSAPTEQMISLGVAHASRFDNADVASKLHELYCRMLGRNSET